MRTNNFKIKILAVAVCLLFAACGVKKEQDKPVTTKNKLDDATSKSVQSNSDRFSDVQVFKDVTKATKEHISNLLDYYHALKDAMVAEEPAKAKSVSQKILKELDAYDASTLPEAQQSFYNSHVKKLKEGSGEISASSEIDQQRKGLPGLTNSLYSLAKAYQANRETLYYQYCPMAFDFQGGYWISNTEEIENPYFGDEMLHCGSTRATLAGN